MSSVLLYHTYVNDYILRSVALRSSENTQASRQTPHIWRTTMQSELISELTGVDAYVFAQVGAGSAEAVVREAQFVNCLEKIQHLPAVDMAASTALTQAVNDGTCWTDAQRSSLATAVQQMLTLNNLRRKKFKRNEVMMSFELYLTSEHWAKIEDKSLPMASRVEVVRGACEMFKCPNPCENTKARIADVLRCRALENTEMIGAEWMTFKERVKQNPEA